MLRNEEEDDEEEDEDDEAEEEADGDVWNRDDTGGNVICPLDRTARRTTERRGAGRSTKQVEVG